MTCMEARSLLSLYLDGAVTGRQMQAVGDHLGGCRDCQTEYVLLQDTQKMVAALPRPRVPADLALNLRVAISRELASARRPWFEGFRVRVENALNAFMLPATAGLVSAMLIFGMLLVLFAIPTPAQGPSAADVPTMLYTPPELATIAPYAISSSINADSVLVEVMVGPDGRVQDFHALQEPADAQMVMPELKNALIFTVFRPALSFGRPVSGKTVLSFSKINVKG